MERIQVHRPPFCYLLFCCFVVCRNLLSLLIVVSLIVNHYVNFFVFLLFLLRVTLFLISESSLFLFLCKLLSPKHLPALKHWKVWQSNKVWQSDKGARHGLTWDKVQNFPSIHFAVLPLPPMSSPMTRIV